LLAEVGAGDAVLLTLEDRKYVGEGPTLGVQYHGIDAAASKYVTKGRVECAIVQSRRRVHGQVVIGRAADIVKPDA
jgi:hypothetical protein